nr:MAG TPA: hypothetical protein [Caudoviricetes sp.]
MTKPEGDVILIEQKKEGHTVLTLRFGREVQMFSCFA